MHSHWKKLATFSVVLLLMKAGSDFVCCAAEDPGRGTAASRNPLRDSREYPAAKPRDAGLTPAAASNLLQQLRADLDADESTRTIIAIYRLRECGAAGAEVLIQLLEKPNLPLESQWATLRSLDDLGEVSVPAMLRLLQHSQDSMHEIAWQALDCLGSRAKSATPFLIQMLRSRETNSQDRARAAKVLGQIGLDAGDACDDLLGIAEQQEDGDLRFSCLRALAHIGRISPAHQTRLVKLLVDDNEEPRLRIAAAAVLVANPSPPQVVLPALIGLAQDQNDAECCIAAIEAIGKLGPEAADAIPTLVKLLDHEWTDVRLAVIAACGSMGASAADAVPPLVRRIQIDDAASVPESAATALIKIDPSAAQFLLPGLSDDDATRVRTLRALLAMGPSAPAAVPNLLGMLADPQQSDLHHGIVRVLREMGPQAAGAIPVLKSLLESSITPVEIRAESALALGAISPETVAELRPVLGNQESSVRIAAAQVLGKRNSHDREAIQVLLREIVNGDDDRTAANALVAIGPDTLPLLRELILDERNSLALRAEVCLVVGRLGTAGVTTLVRALQSFSEELAGAAEQALFNVGPKTAIPALLEAICELEEDATAAIDPDLRDSKVARMRQLIVDMSGGMGGSGSAASTGGLEAIIGGAGGATMSESGPSAAAPSASAPSEALPPVPPEESMPRPAPKPAPKPSIGPRMIQPKSGTRATGSASAPTPAPAPAKDPPAIVPASKLDLKTVKVFYGTNRQPLETAQQFHQFLWRGFLPAMVTGAATILVCGIGFARSRSRWHGALAVVGVLATLGLAFPASQQSTESARSIAHRFGPVYGSASCDQLELGLCEVTIPADHHPGELESPSILRFEFDQDPDKHIVLREVIPCQEEQFHANLKQTLREKGNNILVFVHGYNVDFDNAARRTAQLACDLEFAGAPLFFSWPSQGNWYEYRKDEKQVELAIPHLKRFLLEVATRSQASSIHLIAHSMGNRALTGALKEMASTVESPSTHFNQVVLAAPDIDADVFRERIAPAIITQAQRVTLYASSNDLALTASRTFNSGDLRAGDTSRGLVVTPGIETIDVSVVDTSLLGHSYYGDNPTVLTDLKELLHSFRPADQRPFLEAVPVQQQRYWIFHHPEIASQSTTSAIR